VTADHQGLPVLLGHLVDRFAVGGSERQLDVFIVVYADGVAVTHYFPTHSALQAADEVARRPREPGYVLGGDAGAERPWLEIHEPAFGFSHRIDPEPETDAANVVRALVARYLLSRYGSYSAHRSMEAAEGEQAARPVPRLVRDATEAEELAAEWVRWMGFPRARTTPRGSDGGIDIQDHPVSVVGQVKFEAIRTSRPTLQALYGAGHAAGASNFLSSPPPVTPLRRWPGPTRCGWRCSDSHWTARWRPPTSMAFDSSAIELRSRDLTDDWFVTRR
jgi:hypothetical protein